MSLGLVNEFCHGLLLKPNLCVGINWTYIYFSFGQFQRYGHYKSHKIEDLRRSYHTLKKVLSEHIYILYKAFILNDV